MKHFIATFKDNKKEISFSPRITSLSELKNEIATAFSIQNHYFKLSYRDLEDDEIEIVDQLDFEYFMALGKEQFLEMHVLSDEKVVNIEHPPNVNPFKKNKVTQHEPFIEVLNEKLELTVQSPKPLNFEKPAIPAKQNEFLAGTEDTLLDVFRVETEKQMTEKNLKTLSECISEAEVLTELKEKIEAIKSQMDQSLLEIKGEIVKTKRKNSGIISRAIHSTTVHLKVCCSNCGLNPINGKRYKCVICKQYELCEVCEENNFHASHPMVRLVETKKSPAYYDELAMLIKLALGDLKTSDEFAKKQILRSIFGEQVGNDVMNVILKSRTKKTADELILEFYKLLQ